LDNALDIDGLLAAVHSAALETGVFPIGGLRTRAARREHYRIADGHLDNHFIHIELKIGHGRDLETKKNAGQHVFEAICDYLQPLFDRLALAISFEMVEIDPDLNFKQNNLHQYVQRRIDEVTD
jgi:5-carboxymethyl-2-hydroxymuconate isomerase